jgi:hypothetical protein
MDLKPPTSHCRTFFPAELLVDVMGNLPALSFILPNKPIHSSSRFILLSLQSRSVAAIQNVGVYLGNVKYYLLRNAYS